MITPFSLQVNPDSNGFSLSFDGTYPYLLGCCTDTQVDADADADAVICNM